MNSCLMGKVFWFNKAKGYGEIYGEDERIYFFTYKLIKSKEKFKSIDKGVFVYFSPTTHTHFGRLIADSVREVINMSQHQAPSHLRNIEI